MRSGGGHREGEMRELELQSRSSQGGRFQYFLRRDEVRPSKNGSDVELLMVAGYLKSRIDVMR